MKEQTMDGAVLPKRRPDREHYMTVPEYGRGYDAGWNACLDALASTPQPPPEAGTWRCSQCGDALNEVDSAWRWNGSVWQHHHANVGHVDARHFPPEAGSVGVPDYLRVVAKRNLKSLIERGSDDKALMLSCLAELS